MKKIKVIESSQLTKKFGTLAAVNELSLSVAPGEIYGFVGLNGAGKTTMIRLLFRNDQTYQWHDKNFW